MQLSKCFCWLIEASIKCVPAMTGRWTKECVANSTKNLALCTMVMSISWEKKRKKIASIGHTLEVNEGH